MKKIIATVAVETSPFHAANLDSLDSAGAIQGKRRFSAVKL